jgi:hypothetical protein
MPTAAPIDIRPHARCGEDQKSVHWTPCIGNEASRFPLFSRAAHNILKKLLALPLLNPF